MKTQKIFFRHDSDTHRQPQMLALRKRWGWKGYGLYWAILEMLRESPNYAYTQEYALIAYHLRTNEATIRSIIEDFDLFLLQDDSLFCSDTLNENMELMAEHKNHPNTAAKKRGNPNFQNGKTNPYYARTHAEKEEAETLSEIIPQKEEIIPPLLSDNSPIKEKRKGKKNTTPSSAEEEVGETTVSPLAAAKTARREREEVDFDRVLDLYHRLCPDYPRILKLTSLRRQKIRIRFAEEMNHDWALLETVFRKMQASKFMRGDNRKGWKATFDWVFENPKNWVKVAEGNYDAPPEMTAFPHPPTAATPLIVPEATNLHSPFTENPYVTTANPLSDTDAFHRHRDQQVLQGIVEAFNEL